MIDLHLHTTASDGYLSPAQLVARARTAGLTTISVTDHDTVAAIAEVTERATAVGMRVVSGIEITAVDDGRDVHMLGYFFDPANANLTAMLERQRGVRIARVREIAERLATLDIVIDVESVLVAAAARPGSSVGRPQVARELVRTGYVTSVQQAFDLWLATGRPGFVTRTGPSPASVVDAIHDAGGLASLAHPGVTKRNELITPLIDGGMDAIEVYHTDHTAEAEQMYHAMAQRHGILVTGGSDFHGDETRRNTLGQVTLPEEAFAALESAVVRPRPPSPRLRRDRP